LIRGLFLIIRPINVFITSLSVYAGGIIAGAVYHDKRLLLACIAAGLIAAFGNIVNDIFDCETDKKAKPFRPLPSGRLTLFQAWFFALWFALAGLVI